jgi:hypothetical protein
MELRYHVLSDVTGGEGHGKGGMEKREKSEIKKRKGKR